MFAFYRQKLHAFFKVEKNDMSLCNPQTIVHEDIQ